MAFSLTVSNIGEVATAEHREDILPLFDEYVQLSVDHYGRIDDESVTLWEDGEPIKVFIPNGWTSG